MVGATNIMKLKGKIVENGMTMEDLADALKMDYSTLYRKMKSDGLSFSIKEANDIVNVLKLTGDEAMNIFFSNLVA